MERCKLRLKKGSNDTFEAVNDAGNVIETGELYVDVMEINGGTQQSNTLFIGGPGEINPEQADGATDGDS